MAEAVLALDGVSKSFGGLKVIEDVGFAVRRGARMALIGPNGAGKTTLFNLISGVYAPDQGRILLEGEAIEGLPSRRRIRAGLSRSFQNIRLMPHLSVVENVMLGSHAQDLSLSGLLAPVGWMPRGRFRQEALARLDQAGLRLDPDGSVASLPYGIRKTVEVVRALMSRPKVLMLDEPAAGLNPRETADLCAFLRGVAAEGVTLLVVEHDMGFVNALCEDVVVLNFGRVIYDGGIAGVRGDPAVREAYLGTPAGGRDAA